MSFVWPWMLVLLLAIPLGVALALGLDQRRRRRVEVLGARLANVKVAEQARASSFRRHTPSAIILVGLTVLVVALARPQSVVGVPRIEGTVILAFDVSGSMAAADLEPTRMEAAKAAARAFVERQPPSILIGVVAFSDSGFSIQVPTADEARILAAIDRLAPSRGTSLGRGIQASLTTIAAADEDVPLGYYSNRSPDPTPQPTPVPDGTYAPAAIVLLTDGENNQSPDPLGAADAAAKRGVRIYPVGIGSVAGSTVEIDGFKVHSRLDEPLLRQVAETTGGTYYAAEEPDDLRAVYDEIETRLVVRSEALEVTAIVAGAGMLILLVGALASLVWLGRMP